MNIDGTDLVALTKKRGTVDGALWSPDGKRIAYLFSKYGFALPDNKIPRYTNLYVVNTDGSGAIQLTNNSVNAWIYGFTWSPDSKRIAFSLSNGDSNIYDIFVINSDGSGLKKLTDSHSTIAFPAWSPKGDQIAFVSFRDGIPHIYIMNDDGSDPLSLINGPGGEYALDWSPDGNYLAFCYYSSKEKTVNIYMMDVNTLESTRVTNHNWDIDPRWSPDGKLIAFSSGPRTYAMYMVYPDGSGETPLKSGDWFFADWQP